MAIDNIVFDIGNVLVRWSPKEVIQRTFGESSETDKLIGQIFQNDLWTSLNLGLLSEEEAKRLYTQELDVTPSQVEKLFFHVKDTQDLIEGSVRILEALHVAGYSLFALTDNIREIVSYLKDRYTFWEYFLHATVSADVRCMKPYPEIFSHMLTHNNIDPGRTVFIDDLPTNIEGAQAVGISAILFANPEQCEIELKNLGLVF